MLNKVTEVVVDEVTLVPVAAEPAALTATQIGGLVNVSPPGKVNVSFAAVNVKVTCAAMIFAFDSTVPALL